MAISRPLNKQILQKMYLKMLHEHKRPGGNYTSNSWGYDSILRTTMLHHFKISELTPDELTTARRGIYELERDGYIMQDPTQSADVFKILTEKGRRVVELSLEEMKLTSIDIDQLLSRDELRDIVRNDFIGGDFESAIFKAFRLLEERVRAKAREPASSIGVNLMTAVFRPNGGVLRHPQALVDSEKEALHGLMRGAIGWFKNPSSHRTVGYSNDQQAAHVFAFANLLLDLTDECK